MFLHNLLRKISDRSYTDEIVTVSFGPGYSFALPINHAIALRDAISIQIINAQDNTRSQRGTSRVTNGDME